MYFFILGNGGATARVAGAQENQENQAARPALAQSADERAHYA